MPVEKIKKTLFNRIGAAAEKAYGQRPGQLEIGFPPNPGMGHFAVGCFPLAKQFRKSPAEIAQHIAEHIRPDDIIAEAKAAGPYVNLKIAADILNDYLFIEGNVVQTRYKVSGKQHPRLQLLI